MGLRVRQKMGEREREEGWKDGGWGGADNNESCWQARRGKQLRGFLRCVFGSDHNFILAEVR